MIPGIRHRALEVYSYYYYLVPFSRYSTSKFSRVWPWPLTPLRSSGVKTFYTILKPIYDFLFDFYGHHLSILYRSRYIRLQSFQGLTLTFDPLKVIWGQNILYYSKAPIWHPIWLLWTSSLYLVPFSRYSTSKFLGFDLDLWPLKVIWGQKSLYHLKAHIWLPIWLLWTPSLYLVPFSIYSTSKFSGFDLDRWPLKVIWGQKNLYYFLYYFWYNFFWLQMTLRVQRSRSNPKNFEVEYLENGTS